MKFPNSLPSSGAVDRKSGTSPPLCPHGRVLTACHICQNRSASDYSPFIILDDSLQNSQRPLENPNILIQFLVRLLRTFAQLQQILLPKTTQILQSSQQISFIRKIQNWLENLDEKKDLLLTWIRNYPLILLYVFFQVNY